MFKKRRSLPAVDSPTFGVMVKEVLEVREGARGNLKEEYLTRAEIESLLKKTIRETIYVIEKSSAQDMVGVSTDTKPTGILPGSIFLEYDTGNRFIYTGLDWVLKSGPGLITSRTEVDLQQNAGDYDLFSMGDVGIEIVGLTAIIPADLTGDAAGALTSISIQSTDTPEVVFIPSTAKAQLSKDKHLTFFGNAVVAPNEKIQFSIEGGATTAEQLLPVFIAYRPGGL